MMSMSILRVGIRPCLNNPSVFLRPSFARTTSLARTTLRVPKPQQFGSLALRRSRRGLPLLFTATGIAGIALGVSSLSSSSTLYCDDDPPKQTTPPLPPPPQSSVNVYELTFGTACGICAGVFIKKGARMVAFFLGGVFVLLQFLGSMALVKVDWARMASRFEDLFYTTDAVGNKKPPTVTSIWRWIVDFLTADFQPRASFVAGLALGIRVG